MCICVHVCVVCIVWWVCQCSCVFMPVFVCAYVFVVVCVCGYVRVLVRAWLFMSAVRACVFVCVSVLCVPMSLCACGCMCL